MQPAARASTQARGMVQQLIYARVNKPCKLYLGDRSEALSGRAYGNSCDGTFGERSIKHSVLAVLFKKPVRCPEHTAVYADILAKVSRGLGAPMTGIEMDEINQRYAERGW